MNHLLAFITWNPDPVIFTIGVPLRYYGVLWVTGIILAYFVIRYQFRDKKIDERKLEPLPFYCLFGVFIGARLGHCLFYQPEYYLLNPIEMLFPVQIMPDGGWKFIGYQGLASHGGAIGLIVAMWLYVRKTKQNYIDIVDMIGVAAPLTGFCIRIANLMNSEIIGKVTDVPWAFIFVREDMYPRHPAQLYEAFAYLILFLIGFYIYKHYNKKLHRGFFFGFCLTGVFLFRFFIEFVKEKQVDFEAGMSLDMGQLLSIPFILIGIGSILAGKKLDKLK
ncbi:Prolipoprotein diacylglyceryl transferase [termite gut metagenome]|uniref:Prolipoprotein diacylglyceryl transferase n=2 Tax=termite gut metagenome TaxID=433724 RepID=A0A5J4PLD9_9ZZZZ